MKDRSIKELLELLLKEIESSGALSLGCLVGDLNFKGIISWSEKIAILTHFDLHLPKERYGWKLGEVKPRIKWLKEQIEIQQILEGKNINEGKLSRKERYALYSLILAVGLGVVGGLLGWLNV